MATNPNMYGSKAHAVPLRHIARTAFRARRPRTPIATGAIGSPDQAADQAAAASNSELRVCVNKTCRKQGSEQVLKVLQDLELDSVEISSSGCLGNCGSGPNVAVLPAGYVARGIATPSQAFQLLNDACNVKLDPRDTAAIQLRLQGNALAMSGDAAGAYSKYADAAAQEPPHGIYKLYSNMSLAALTMGDAAAAMEAALLAVDNAPNDWTTAKIRCVEACIALGDREQAETWLLRANRVDPSFRSTLVHKGLADKLQKL